MVGDEVNDSVYGNKVVLCGIDCGYYPNMGNLVTELSEFLYQSERCRRQNISLLNATVDLPGILKGVVNQIYLSSELMELSVYP